MSQFSAEQMERFSRGTKRQSIYREISEERERQISLGYTKEHDLEHGGPVHPLGWGATYADRAAEWMERNDPTQARKRAIQAIALLVAAVELLDDQKSSTEEEACQA